MRIRILPAKSAGALIIAVLALLGLAAHATASAGQQPRTAPAAPRAAGEVAAVEDGAYPDAEKIEQERGVTLIGGNGLITLADCGTPGLIQVRATGGVLVCFKARIWPGTESFITVKIPETYSVKGDDHQVKAKLTTEDGVTKSYDIERNQWTSVGEGLPDNGPETLIELRAKA